MGGGTIYFSHGNSNNINNNNDDNTERHLHPDQKILLDSFLSLLKSCNSEVVMAVCSLHYYYGVASVTIRSALGRALVQIYRDWRDTMYVVLSSARMLAWECPSAFTPFPNVFCEGDGSVVYSAREAGYTLHAGSGARIDQGGSTGAADVHPAQR